eukprot:TRINITY_DN13790_c0_g2_i1.p1 TRINITY_DN13790_c0_g2~~TRINITY_DN13790_c0_g2_i1.p1  ORF type:complete len:114 (-),score=15.47 TRINITY_DN13790_c0_g2_i1:17-358(-)
MEVDASGPVGSASATDTAPYAAVRTSSTSRRNHLAILQTPNPLQITPQHLDMMFQWMQSIANNKQRRTTEIVSSRKIFERIDPNAGDVLRLWKKGVSERPSRLDGTIRVQRKI